MQNNQVTEMKAPQTQGAKFCADAEIVTVRHVVLGILPFVKTTSLRLDAKLATHAIFQMLRQMRSPTESQRMKDSKQLGCVSQDSHLRKSILRKEVKL